MYRPHLVIEEVNSVLGHAATPGMPVLQALKFFERFEKSQSIVIEPGLQLSVFASILLELHCIHLFDGFVLSHLFLAARGLLVE